MDEEKSIKKAVEIFSLEELLQKKALVEKKYAINNNSKFFTALQRINKAIEIKKNKS